MAFEKKQLGGLERVNICLPANASMVDSNCFYADKPWEVIGVEEVHATAGTDVGAVTLDVKKCTGTQAPSAGATVLGTTFDMKGTINTVVKKTLGNGGLTTTAASRFLAAGDRLALDFTGTVTALAGVQVMITLRPVGPKSSYY